VTLLASAFNPPTATFTNWQLFSNGSPVQTSKANPFTFTMTGNIQAVLDSSGSAGTSGVVIDTDVSGGGTVSPATTTIFSSASLGATTAAFTATPSQGNSFSGWTLYGCNAAKVSPFPGTASGETVTLTWAQVQGATAACGGQGPITLSPSFGNNPALIVQDNPLYPGKVTLSPAPGTYYTYAQGENVTVAGSSVASGYRLAGWDVNGFPQATGQSSVTVTINSGTTAVNPVIVTAGTTTSGGGSGTSASCSPSSFSPSSNAGITVTVYNSSTGRDVANATVSTAAQSATTNSQGQAVISNIAVPNSFGSSKGTVTVNVSAPGYNSGSQSVQVQQGQCSSASVGLSAGLSIGGTDGLLIGFGVAAAGVVVLGFEFVRKRGN
jgi:hypothetical protein